MKLLSKALLTEYGFFKNDINHDRRVEIMTKDEIDIFIKDDLFYYSDKGLDYPLKDIASLKKLYKKIKDTDLKPVQ